MLPESSIAGVTVKAPGSFTVLAVRVQARYCLTLLTMLQPLRVCDRLIPLQLDNPVSPNSAASH